MGHLLTKKILKSLVISDFITATLTQISLCCKWRNPTYYYVAIRNLHLI